MNGSKQTNALEKAITALLPDPEAKRREPDEDDEYDRDWNFGDHLNEEN